MKFYYFHGFGSNPQAKKADAMRKVLGADKVNAPDFNLSSGKEVKALLDYIASDIKNSAKETFIVGSSLGGLYALYVSSICGCKCLLLNPCLFPQAIIGTLSSNVNIEDVVLAQEMSLTAYSSYNPDNVQVWVTKNDMLINHDVLTKPFFYKKPAEYKIFPKSKASGHEFKGFKGIFAKFILNQQSD